MKEDKIVKAAKGAKKDGYEFIYSLIMKQNKQRVYHTVHVDEIILYRKWRPASVMFIKDKNGKETPVVNGTASLPKKAISKAEALRKYK